MKKLFITLSLLLVSVTTSHAQLLAFDFEGSTWNSITGDSDIAPDVIAPGIDASLSAVSRGVGVAATNSPDTFSSTGWMNSGISEALANDDYLSFTIAPEAGYALNIDAVSMNLQGGGDMPSEFFLFSSAFKGGFVENDHYFQSGFGGAFGLTTYFNSSFGMGGLTGPVEFRVYGVGASSDTGSFGFGGDGYGIQITGTLDVIPGTNAVPEPSTYGILGGLVLLGLIAMRHRRQ